MLSIVLLVIGCVLAPIGVTASWAKNLVVNQDAYLEAVAPLITDPAIVSAAETRLVAGIDDAITNLQLADKIGTELQSLGPAAQARHPGHDLPGDVPRRHHDRHHENGRRITAEPQTRDDLGQRQRHPAHEIRAGHARSGSRQVAHPERRSQRGGGPGQTETRSRRVWTGPPTFPMCPVVIDIAGNANVQRVAGYYDLLVTLGTWLPILAILLLLISILIAPSRLGGLSKAAGWLAVLDGRAGAGADHRAAVADFQVAAAAGCHAGVHPAAHGQPAGHRPVHRRCRRGDLGRCLAVRAVEERGRTARRGARAGRTGCGTPGGIWPSGSPAAIVAIALVLVLLNLENPSVLLGGVARSAGRAGRGRCRQSAARRRMSVDVNRPSRTVRPSTLRYSPLS